MGKHRYNPTEFRTITDLMIDPIFLSETFLLALLFQFVGKPALEAAIRQWKHEYIRQNNRCSGWLVQGQQILFCPHLVGYDISSILANDPLFRGRQMLSWYLSMVLARTCNRSSESKERQQKPSILTLHLRNVFKKGSQASLPQIVRNGFYVITFSFFAFFYLHSWMYLLRWHQNINLTQFCYENVFFMYSEQIGLSWFALDRRRWKPYNARIFSSF